MMGSREGCEPCLAASDRLVSGFYFDDVVRGAFALAGGGDLDVARFFAQGGKVAGAEVSHAGLECRRRVGS